MRDRPRWERQAVAQRWLSDGGAAVEGVGRVKADFSGRCMCPVGFTLWGVPTKPLEVRGLISTLAVADAPVHGVENTSGPLRLTGEGRCRRCLPCLLARSREWTRRAEAEIRAAKRTWFGTLTLAPEWHARYLAQARARCSAQGVDYDAQDYGQQYFDRVREVGPELRRYLKRVRKASGAPLRFMMVQETHKSGLPHWHCLIHELSDVDVIRKRILRDQWVQGYSRWKLVDTDKGAGAARYVSKYLNKQALARVRASLHYGAAESAEPLHALNA